jgi:hypothetical protein
MILLKVLLSESQIAAYQQPVGTRDMQCGAGLNCMFCTLKMLGVYSPEIENMSLTCGPRHAEGKPIKAKELIPYIKEAVKGITDEEHDFKFDVMTGDPTGPLSALVADLKPQEACFFIYGRNGNGSHAVVLRRGSDGILELIDPQRGQADIGKEFGFTAERAAELGLEVTPNYYRVRGEEEITTVMIEQSALFKYWPSKNAVESNIHNFVIGTLMVDNVVGLKMLIDDNNVSETMDVDDSIRRPKDIRMKERESQETDYGSQVGGDPKTPPPTPVPVRPPQTPETQTANASITQSVGIATPPLSLGQRTPTGTITPPVRTDYASDTSSVLAPKSKSLDDAKEDILNTFLDKQGKYRFIYISKDESESDEEEEEEEEEEEQEGGSGVGQKRRRVDDSGSSPADKYSQAKENYTKYISEETGAILTHGENTEGPTVDVAETTLLLLSQDKPGTKFPALLGLDRTVWETPSATTQCSRAKVLSDRPCWMCGNPVNMGQSGSLINGKRMSVCDPDDNQFECEHVLPGVFMLFLKMMINKTLPGKEQSAIDANLYDSSCHICNTVKSNGLYIKSSWKGDALEFSPHPEKIMADIVTFIVSTRVGQTVELQRVFTQAEVGAAIASAKLRPPPICSSKPAVHFYGSVKKADGEFSIFRSVFTSITSVAEPVNEDVKAKFATALGDTSTPEAAAAAEEAAAYAVARRFNNLTRATIEYPSPPPPPAAADADTLPPLDVYLIRYLLSEAPAEKKLLWDVVKLPTEAESGVPYLAAVVPNPNPDGTMAQAAPHLEDTTSGTEKRAALLEADIPLSVDRKKAWNWIHSRYVAIYTRMKALCEKLNDAATNKDIVTATKKLATEPLLTLQAIKDLGALSKIKPLVDPTPPARVGGVHITIRRRSDARTTKKNKKRRTIDVRV